MFPFRTVHIITCDNDAIQQGTKKYSFEYRIL